MENALGTDQKSHFAALDGLRGFAAISVVLFHLGHWLNAPKLATNSWLAVDLFFCLSGYVLPRAYLRRSTAEFFRVRLIRLMPLILIGIVISSTYIVLRSSHVDGSVPFSKLITAFVLGCFNLPYFGAPKSVGGPELFPLNGPQYTLFLELFINALWWMSRGVNQLWLSICLALFCFIFLPFLGLGGDLPATFWSGFPRVGASFFAGVAIFNMAARIPRSGQESWVFWLCCALMILIFFWPVQLPLAVQLVWVSVLSPLLVFTGSRIRFGRTLSQFCSLGGALSYPIYCLHYPIFEWINGVYRERFGPQDIMIEGPIVLMTVLCLGYVILKVYDERVRRFLTAR